MEEFCDDVIEQLTSDTCFFHGVRHLEVAHECLSKPITLINIAICRVFEGQSELPAAANLIVYSSFFFSTSKLVDLVNLFLCHMVNISEDYVQRHLFHLTVLT